MFVPNRVLVPIAAVALVCIGIAMGALMPAVSTPPRPGHGRALQYLPGSDREPKLTSRSAILVDVGTRTVLYSLRPKQRRAPASTTKILTALLAIERGRLSDVITVSGGAAGTPGSRLRLRKGDRMTLGELVTGMMLRSGNDAAEAIAQHIAGTTEAFAGLMNERARALGASDSNFVNPHGLDGPKHYTTARDLALITLAAIENPRFAKTVRQKKAQVGTARETWSREISNTNQLLWSFEGAEGVKTGTTSRAGKCLVALASRQGRQLLAVILNSASRYWDAKVLLNYGFNSFTVVTGAEKDEIVDVVDIRGGMEETATLVAGVTTEFVVRNEELEALELVMRMPSPLKAPLRTKQVVGHLVASAASRELASTPLMVREGVARSTWWRRLWRWVRLSLGGPMRE